MDVNKGIFLDDVLFVVIIFVFNCKFGIWFILKYVFCFLWIEVGFGLFYLVRNYLKL